MGDDGGRHTIPAQEPARRIFDGGMPVARLIGIALAVVGLVSGCASAVAGPTVTAADSGLGAVGDVVAPSASAPLVAAIEPGILHAIASNAAATAQNLPRLRGAGRAAIIRETGRRALTNAGLAADPVLTGSAALASATQAAIVAGDRAAAAASRATTVVTAAKQAVATAKKTVSAAARTVRTAGARTEQAATPTGKSASTMARAATVATTAADRAAAALTRAKVAVAAAKTAIKNAKAAITAAKSAARAALASAQAAEDAAAQAATELSQDATETALDAARRARESADRALAAAQTQLDATGVLTDKVRDIAPALKTSAATVKRAAAAAIRARVLARQLADCHPAARACIDLTRNETWLQQDGAIVYGPVPITSGRPGYRTHPGLFSVFWKDKNHLSSIFNNAPMPNSIFFDGGIAFHQGSLSIPSHGCIHLSWGASQRYWDFLRYGDRVSVFGFTRY